MQTIWDVNYLVVDVETTGHDAIMHRMTEIACVIVNDGSIVNQYSSLINPHQFIPPFISKMTGISNEMVFLAPEASEVIGNLNSILPIDKNIFVAHNVKFDYSFVFETFKRVGIDFPVMQQLCTYKLSKKLLKKELKKNVGSLAKYFGIQMLARHRALDDAKATAKILIELINIANNDYNISSYQELLTFQNKINSFKIYPVSYKKIEDKIKLIPDVPGVYYYLDKSNKIIYVGKAKSLKKRVASYYSSGTNHSSKVKELLKYITDIKWEETPTELQALLLETKEIKKYKPMYNRIDKEYKYYPLLKIHTNEDYPRLQKSYTIKDDKAEYFGPFRSGLLVEEIANLIDRNFKLRKCENPLKPSIDFRPCFYYHIKRCEAPCALLQTKEEYLLEVDKVKNFLRGFAESIINEYEIKMEQLAQNMDFEKAAEMRDDLFEIRRLFSRAENVPTSIEKNNLILILPNSEIDKTIDIYLFKFGLLFYQETIGRKASIDPFIIKINNTYFNDTLNKTTYSIEEINEVKIITSWLYRQQEKGFIIYLEGKNIEQIKDNIIYSIKNINYNLLSESE